MKIKSAAVIGGGFYACYLACDLAASGVEVELFERESELMSRASLFNQARVHGGYHYPRHTPTALRSRVNYPRFKLEFGDCLNENFKHIYAIPRANSKVSAKQFYHFMTKIGSSLEPVSSSDLKLFADGMIEQAFYVDECTFDAVKLREKMKTKLQRLGVKVHLNGPVQNISESASEKLAVTTDRTQVFDLVLNCTYSDLLDLKFVKNPGVLEFEIAELALVELPPSLKSYGFTVMCGQFFSTIPFPSTDFHSLSHVRYTPHVRWTSIERVDSTKVLQEYNKQSRFEHMVRDAQKFIPELRKTKYVKSFFEVKTLLPQNAGDDGRPILFEMDKDHPNFVSILGGKIDNVYDISDRIKEEFLK